MLHPVQIAMLHNAKERGLLFDVVVVALRFDDFDTVDYIIFSDLYNSFSAEQKENIVAILKQKLAAASKEETVH